mmetsp:Transcript_4232/g.13535  ORF Transcript_4232/g.13535 Transcript_4232/m.13535 type:complete len:234 (-) Transcript_4232:1142-1843(-)
MRRPGAWRLDRIGATWSDSPWRCSGPESLGSIMSPREDGAVRSDCHVLPLSREMTVVTLHIAAQLSSPQRRQRASSGLRTWLAIRMPSRPLTRWKSTVPAAPPPRDGGAARVYGSDTSNRRPRRPDWYVCPHSWRSVCVPRYTLMKTSSRSSSTVYPISLPRSRDSPSWLKMTRGNSSWISVAKLSWLTDIVACRLSQSMPETYSCPTMARASATFSRSSVSFGPSAASDTLE